MESVGEEAKRRHRLRLAGPLDAAACEADPLAHLQHAVATMDDRYNEHLQDVLAVYGFPVRSTWLLESPPDLEVEDLTKMDLRHLPMSTEEKHHAKAVLAKMGRAGEKSRRKWAAINDDLRRRRGMNLHPKGWGQLLAPKDELWRLVKDGRPLDVPDKAHGSGVRTYEIYHAVDQRERRRGAPAAVGEARERLLEETRAKRKWRREIRQEE